MNAIVTDRMREDACSWHFHSNAKAPERYGKETREFIPLSATELATVLHPSGDWVLKAQFDARALDHQDRAAFLSFDCDIKWSKRMRKESTIADLFAAIEGTYAYGYFEGLVRTADTDTLGHPRTISVGARDCR